MALVFRPSNTRPGGQKRDFWRRCRNSLINSPVFWGLRGSLGFEAPYCVKEGSGRPSHGLSLPAFTSRHSGKVLRQGPPLAGWSQPPCGGHISEGRSWWDGGWRVCKLSFGVEWNGACFQTLKHTSKGSTTRFSGAVAIIHWLTHQYFEGCVAALGLRPQKI